MRERDEMFEVLADIYPMEQRKMGYLDSNQRKRDGELCWMLLSFNRLVMVDVEDNYTDEGDDDV